LLPPPHRQGMKGPFKSSVHRQMRPTGATTGTSPGVSVLFNMVIDNPLPILGPLKMVARQSQRVVKVTRRRHGQSPFVSCCRISTKILPWRRFFNSGFGCASPTGPLTAHSRRSASPASLPSLFPHPPICRMNQKNENHYGQGHERQGKEIYWRKK